jgi:pantoate--beta-alanine ligase
MMEEIATVAMLRARLDAHRRAGRRIGFVPTMGFLHEGHLALVDAARAAAEVVVMSIFVNPLQFGPGEDLERYPRDLARDRTLAAGRGVTVLFTPSVAEMYGEAPEIRVVAGETAARWEGAARPGHFDGVLTVVAKLFHQVMPDVAVFGQKDIQQVTLIRRMVAELDFPVSIVVVRTVREADGLARSSRNVYLTPRDREAALALSRGLFRALDAWRAGERDADVLQKLVEDACRAAPGVVPDYIAVVDPERLAPVETAPPGTIIAVAARVGATRLIDNIILGPEHT